MRGVAVSTYLGLGRPRKARLDGSGTIINHYRLIEQQGASSIALIGRVGVGCAHGGVVMLVAAARCSLRNLCLVAFQLEDDQYDLFRFPSIQ